jgi:flagellar protein FlaJ
MIPFVPVPLKKAIKHGRVFLGIGNGIAKAFPSLKLDLYQAEIDVQPREYGSVIAFTSAFYLIVLFGLTFFIGTVVGRPDLLISSLVGGSFSLFVFFYLITYPKLIAHRRMRKLERNLINALSHMMIEVRSGIPLFNALVGVSEDYGEVSEEFKNVVEQINAGTSEADALEESSRKNPSLYFRRAVWQIVNALRAGSDIAQSLQAIIDVLIREQMLNIRKYGQELSPLTMMYMLFAVIVPSLGITFLIIISSFSGITIPKILLPLIVFVLVVFQFFYMGIIKTKRPVMEV